MSQRKMSPNIKKYWLKALLSGRFVQGQGALYKRSTNQYCCLGVLCQVINKKKRFTGISDKYSSYTPDNIVERSKLSSNTMHKLTQMNDQKNKTFPEIAAWIERNL